MTSHRGRKAHTSHRRSAIFDQRVFAASLIVLDDLDGPLMVATLMERFGISRSTAFRRLSEARRLLADGRGRLAYAAMRVVRR